MTKYLHSIFPLMLFSIYRFRFCLRYTHKAMYIIASKSNIYAVHSLCCFSLFRKTNRNLFYRIQIERNSINVRRTCLHTLSGASEECLNQFLYHNIWFILFLLFFSVVNTYAMPENTFPTIYVVIVVVVFDYFITNLNKYTYFFLSLFCVHLYMLVYMCEHAICFWWLAVALFWQTYTFAAQKDEKLRCKW